MIPQSNHHEPVNVHSLICHRDIELSLHCLKSLELCSQDPVRIVLHDDGSLTEADFEQITSTLEHSSTISRHSADELMAEHLSNYPSAMAFRRDSVWGLKLFDIVLLENRSCFYCDGDIRFFKPFAGLFTETVALGRSIFLADTIWEAYSVRPWHLMDRRKLRIQSGINTGLTIIDRSVYDLEFVEWFVRQPDWRCIPAWTEPTCWAGIAARTDGHVVSPLQMVNLYPDANIVEETFAGHFLSSYRKQWADLLTAKVDVDAKQSIAVKLLKTKACSPARLLQSQLKRKVSNTIQVCLGK